MRTSIRKGSGFVAEFRSPIAGERVLQLGGAVRLEDLSGTPLNRTWMDRTGATLGSARRAGTMLAFSVSPGEWIEVGGSPATADDVDLSHTRAVLRISGGGNREVLSYVCAIDLGERMMPNGAAARTLVAGVATEVVRDDVDGERSFLLLMSRSFARHVSDRLRAIGAHLASADRGQVAGRPADAG